MTDGDVFLALQHPEHRGEDGALRGAVAVVEGIGRRRHRDEFLTAHREVLERSVLREVAGVHHADLRGHEAVRDLVVGDEAVQGVQVVPHVLRDDADAGAARQGGILVHHVGVEAVAGEGRHAVPRLEAIVLPVPGAEVHQIALLQHAALGLAGGAGGVEQDVEALRFGEIAGRGRQ